MLRELAAAPSRIDSLLRKIRSSEALGKSMKPFHRVLIFGLRPRFRCNLLESIQFFDSTPKGCFSLFDCINRWQRHDRETVIGCEDSWWPFQRKICSLNPQSLEHCLDSVRARWLRLRAIER